MNSDHWYTLDINSLMHIGVEGTSIHLEDIIEKVQVPFERVKNCSKGIKSMGVITLGERKGLVRIQQGALTRFDCFAYGLAAYQALFYITNVAKFESRHISEEFIRQLNKSYFFLKSEFIFNYELGIDVLTGRDGTSTALAVLETEFARIEEQIMNEKAQEYSDAYESRRVAYSE